MSPPRAHDTAHEAKHIRCIIKWRHKMNWLATVAHFALFTVCQCVVCGETQRFSRSEYQIHARPDYAQMVGGDWHQGLKLTNYMVKRVSSTKCTDHGISISKSTNSSSLKYFRSTSGMDFFPISIPALNLPLSVACEHSRQIQKIYNDESCRHYHVVFHSPILTCDRLVRLKDW